MSAPSESVPSSLDALGVSSREEGVWIDGWEYIRADAAEVAKAHLGDALAELAAARREIVELRAHELAVAEAIGIVYHADGHNAAPGPRDLVIGEIKRVARAGWGEP